MLLELLSLIETEEDRHFVIKLYENLNKRMLGYAYKLTHNIELSRDIVQYAFVRIIEKSTKLQKMRDDEIIAYVFTIMKNEFFRLQKRQTVAIIDELDFVDDVDTEESVMEKFTKEELESAMRRITDDHRTIILMKYGLNMPHKEIAIELGISESASQNLLARAIKALKDQMQEGDGL